MTKPNTLKGYEAWARWSARPKICFNRHNKITTKWIKDASNDILPLIRKNRVRVSPTEYSGATHNKMEDKLHNAIYTTLEQKINLIRKC